MLESKKDLKDLSLGAGPTWPSFEQFRQEGARALEAVGNGVIATLQTKTGSYRILAENDFQRIYGLARDVHRLRNGLNVVMVAARAAQKHHDEETLETLIQAVAMLGQIPSLPTRDGHEALAPEGLAVDEDDDVILDPAELYSAISSSKG